MAPGSLFGPGLEDFSPTSSQNSSQSQGLSASSQLQQTQSTIDMASQDRARRSRQQQQTQQTQNRAHQAQQQQQPQQQPQQQNQQQPQQPQTQQQQQQPQRLQPQQLQPQQLRPQQQPQQQQSGGNRPAQPPPTLPRGPPPATGRVDYSGWSRSRRELENAIIVGRNAQRAIMRMEPGFSMERAMEIGDDEELIPLEDGAGMNAQGIVFGGANARGVNAFILPLASPQSRIKRMAPLMSDEPSERIKKMRLHSQPEVSMLDSSASWTPIAYDETIRRDIAGLYIPLGAFHSSAVGIIQEHGMKVKSTMNICDAGGVSKSVCVVDFTNPLFLNEESMDYQDWSCSWDAMLVWSKSAREDSILLDHNVEHYHILKDKFLLEDRVEFPLIRRLDIMLRKKYRARPFKAEFQYYKEQLDRLRLTIQQEQIDSLRLGSYSAGQSLQDDHSFRSEREVQEDLTFAFDCEESSD